MSPQEYALELAKRLYANNALAEACLWCALVMRSRASLDAVLGRAIEGTRHLEGAVLATGSPPLHGDQQLLLLDQLRAAFIREDEPDWPQVQHVSAALLRLIRTDGVEGLPGADSTLLDLFDGQLPIEVK